MSRSDTSPVPESLLEALNLDSVDPPPPYTEEEEEEASSFERLSRDVIPPREPPGSQTRYADEFGTSDWIPDWIPEHTIIRQSAQEEPMQWPSTSPSLRVYSSGSVQPTRPSTGGVNVPPSMPGGWPSTSLSLRSGANPRFDLDKTLLDPPTSSIINSSPRNSRTNFPVPSDNFNQRPSSSSSSHHDRALPSVPNLPLSPSAADTSPRNSRISFPVPDIPPSSPTIEFPSPTASPPPEASPRSAASSGFPTSEPGLSPTFPPAAPLSPRSSIHSSSSVQPSPTLSVGSVSSTSSGDREVYIINDQKTRALTTTVEAKHHLALLGAFAQLRKEVEEVTEAVSPVLAKQENAERRWSLFVGLAVERFERWVRLAKYESLEKFIAEELPPLDVVMVWHTYLLNPGWYAEDTARLSALRSLKAFEPFFLLKKYDVAGLVTQEPTETRLMAWRDRILYPFNPFVCATFLTERLIACPECDKKTEVPLIVPIEDPAHWGCGYLQNLCYPCKHCQRSLTNDSLGAAKFVNTALEEVDFNRIDMEYFFAGTLYTQVNDLNVKHAMTFKNLINGNAIFDPKTSLISQNSTKAVKARRILSKVKYSRLEIGNQCTAGMRKGDVTLARRIMSAYSNDKPFSVDLVGAVLRQASFVKKMHDLGWTASGFFDRPSEEGVLLHCIARYHGFLDLMSASVGQVCVPTLDIDLAWHTHQLKPEIYRAHCKKFVMRYIDHDDKVEENTLSDAFDVTCKAWQRRFKLPYSYCGCPLPGDTIGLKFSFMKKNYDSNDNPLKPPINGYDATHPSDHNGVIDCKQIGEVDRQRQARTIEERRRRQRAAKELSKGKSDGGHYVRGNQLNHDRPFYYPIPFSFFGGVSAGNCSNAGGNVYGGWDNSTGSNGGAEPSEPSSCGATSSGGAACSTSGPDTSGGGSSSNCAGGSASNCVGASASSSGGGSSSCRGGGSSCGGGGGCGGGGCGG